MAESTDEKKPGLLDEFQLGSLKVSVHEKAGKDGEQQFYAKLSQTITRPDGSQATQKFVCNLANLRDASSFADDVAREHDRRDHPKAEQAEERRPEMSPNAVEVRDLTREVRQALLLDVWPSSAAIVDFGLKTPAHLGALQWAVKNEGVTLEQLDAALGKGEALQALVSEENPYRDVQFATAWDDMPEEFGYDEVEVGVPFELKDDLPWRNLYPELPTVEEAQRQDDPMIWFKTHDPGVTEFYVAGYTEDVRLLSFDHRGEGTKPVVFEERNHRFYGLLVSHHEREGEWTEIDGDTIHFEGPGELILPVDSTWLPGRFSEVLKQLSGFKIAAPDVTKKVQTLKEKLRDEYAEHEKSDSQKQTPEPQQPTRGVKRSF